MPTHQPSEREATEASSRVRVRDITLTDGRTCRTYVAAADVRDAPVVFWHQGTPALGTPPLPLLGSELGRNVTWIGADRGGYGTSSRRIGRSIASTAQDVAEVLDHYGVDQCSALGYSGGGPHALGTAAVAPTRTRAVAVIAGLAPRRSLDAAFWDGMAPSAAHRLRAATQGLDAITAHLRSTEFNPGEFTDADHAALSGTWAWLGLAANTAEEGGLDGVVDDELAYVGDWGFDVRDIRVPVLLVQGDADRIVPVSHAEWLAQQIDGAVLNRHADFGHVSVLQHSGQALDWLVRMAS